MERIDKPWGHELIWAHTPKYVGKLLCIDAGASLSLQYHVEKDETIYLQKGRLRLRLGEETRELAAGDSAHIAPGIVHRMEAVDACEVVEVSTPELADVVRLEDRYGRAEAAPAGKAAA